MVATNRVTGLVVNATSIANSERTFHLMIVSPHRFGAPVCPGTPDRSGMLESFSEERDCAVVIVDDIDGAR